MSQNDHRSRTQRLERGEPVTAGVLGLSLGAAVAVGAYMLLRFGWPGLASPTEIWYLYWNYDSLNVSADLVHDGHEKALLFVAAAFGVPMSSVVLAAADRRPMGQVLAWGSIGALLGGVLGMCGTWLAITPGVMAPFVPALAALSFGAVLPTMLVNRTPARKSKTLRGVTLEKVEPISPAKLMEQAARTGRVPLAGQLLPKGAEQKHTLCLGSTGVGKSQVIHHCLEYASRSGWTIICIDPSGAYASTHPRKGDIIFNPDDRRSARWDILADIRKPADIGLVADAICPPSTGDFFASAANKILRAVLLSAKRRGATSAEVVILLVNDLTKNSLRESIGHLEGSGAEEFFDDANSRAFGSILLTLSTSAEKLRPLAEQAEGRWLSLSQFVGEADTRPGSLFLTYNDDQISILGPLYSLMLNVLISRVLSLPPDEERRVLLVADEFDALGGTQEKKTPIGSLPSALVRGRKYGLSVLLGAQSLSQIRDVYGREGGDSILENLSTRLILSVSGETAEFASSRLLGEAEIEIRERSDSVSHTAGAASGRSESTNHRLSQDRLVLPAEINSLPPLNGYLKVTGSSVVQRIHWAHYGWPELRAPFIPVASAGWGEPAPETPESLAGVGDEHDNVAAVPPARGADVTKADAPAPDPMALLREAGVISGPASEPDDGDPVGIISGADDDDALDEALDALGYEYA
ncbi:MAG: type IV secretion system DNA-binding domain-containing protein [Pigmentiphaga sp.]